MINSYLCAIRVITLKHNNEELRNTNGCYLVTQFSSSSTNRLILSELSFLAKVTEKVGRQYALINALMPSVYLLSHTDVYYLLSDTYINIYLFPEIQ